MTVSSEEGQYLYKSKGPNSDQLCGLYLMAPPDKMIFLHIDYLNVPCEPEGLVVVSRALTLHLMNFLRSVILKKKVNYF